MITAVTPVLKIWILDEREEYRCITFMLGRTHTLMRIHKDDFAEVIEGLRQGFPGLRVEQTSSTDFASAQEPDEQDD